VKGVLNIHYLRKVRHRVYIRITDAFPVCRIPKL